MTLTARDIDDLTVLETAMWALETRGDVSWMDDHLAPGFTEFGRSGRVYSRADILAMPIGEIDVQLPLRDVTVRGVADDTALVTYRSIEGRGPSNRSSLWRRRAGRWRLEFHHGSAAPDT